MEDSNISEPHSSTPRQHAPAVSRTSGVASSRVNAEQLTKIKELIERCLTQVGRVFISEHDHALLVLTALIARGHVLLEGVPGVAKTTLAHAVAQVIGCPMKRVQFTPDLLPADILGGAVFNPQLGEFKMIRGPIFTHVLLADEINRAPAKTQAALLEAMQESQVTLEGASEPLPDPFFTIATQNPAEHFGVYPLPEAQLDRFALCVQIGYPSEIAELSMIHDYQSRRPKSEVCMNPNIVLQLRLLAGEVFTHPEILQYIISLARATRRSSLVKLGVSPRACLTLTQLCKARALMAGRAYVSPQDVQQLLTPAWAHRIHLTEEGLYEGVTQLQVIQRTLNEVKYHGPRAPKAEPSTAQSSTAQSPTSSRSL